MAGYYNAPVHTLVHPSQLSTYSSLAGALTPAAPISQFGSPSRERVPQTACKSVNTPAFEPIAFDYYSQARQGVALRDFNVKSQTALNQLLSGASDSVLSTSGIHKVDLRIMVSLFPERESDRYLFRLIVARLRTHRLFIHLRCHPSDNKGPTWYLHRKDAP
jgi:hypothetical protein